jgi:uncharacterized protein
VINDPEAITRLLRTARTVAVVGVSPDPDRDSHRVAAYLQQHGYRIIPVNPRISEVLGERAYPSLRAVTPRPDVVDVFRRPEFVPDIVTEAIALSVPALWLQLGVVHPEAARAVDAGMTVVMDRCMMAEHRRRQPQAAP